MKKAIIEPDREGRGLWIIIKEPGYPDGGVMLPLTEDEVEPVRDACEVWLEKESQRIMKQKKFLD